MPDYSKPIILPFSSDGRIYVLQDEKGETICTGTREVCEVLSLIIGNQGKARLNTTSGTTTETHSNVRSVIVI